MTDSTRKVAVVVTAVVLFGGIIVWRTRAALADANAGAANGGDKHGPVDIQVTRKAKRPEWLRPSVPSPLEKLDGFHATVLATLRITHNYEEIERLNREQKDLIAVRQMQLTEGGNALFVHPISPAPNGEGTFDEDLLLVTTGPLPADVNAAEREQFGVITHFMPESPLPAAGLQAGDLILSVNDTAIRRSAPCDHARELTLGAPVGSTVVFHLVRNGEKQDISVNKAVEKLGYYCLDAPFVP